VSSRKLEVDFTRRGRVQVIADSQVMFVKGLMRGGPGGEDPRDPVFINAVLDNGETLRRRADLWAWNPGAQAWVYLADDDSIEVNS
jgi:hypothetical protein